jgi:cytochrome d ubiquinol oxidase subunit II
MVIAWRANLEIRPKRFKKIPLFIERHAANDVAHCRAEEDREKHAGKGKYTVLAGLLAVATLTVHGANYVALKTEGDLRERARRAGGVAWWPLVVLTALSLIASLYIRPQALDNFNSHPWGWLMPAMVMVTTVALPLCRLRENDRAAFLASSLYIIGTLNGAAFALYPILLPASTDPRYSLTIENTKTGAYSLSVGLLWWLVGIALAIGYFTFLYRFFRGKVRLSDDGY